MEKRSVKTSRRVPRVFIGIGILLLFFIFLELLARILSVTLLKSTLEVTDLRTKLEHISVPPTLPAKRPDQLRVFVYGESTAEGFPIKSHGFANILDYQLHHIFNEQKNVEVVNLGRSGYDSSMIRYVVISTIVSDPDVIVIYMGHNEFVFPELDYLGLHKLIQVLRDKSALFKLLLLAAQYKVPQTGESLELPDKTPGVPFRIFEPYYNLKLSIFKKNVQAIVDLAKARHIPVIFSTAASNVIDWPPTNPKAAHVNASREYVFLVDTLARMIEDGKSEEALSIIQELRTTHNDDAYLMYLEAKCLSRLDKWDEARILFEEAKDRSYMPSSAPRVLNDFLRSLADNKGVWVVDTDKEFHDMSPHHLPGYNLFLDNTHPTLEGNYFIASSIVNLLKEKRIVKPDWWENTAPLITLAEISQQTQPDPEEAFRSHITLALYCMKFHFSNYTCARRELDEAEKAKPDDWHIPAMRGIMSLRDGRESEGKAYFAKANKLHPEEWTKEDYKQTIYLYEYRGYHD